MISKDVLDALPVGKSFNLYTALVPGAIGTYPAPSAVADTARAHAPRGRLRAVTATTVVCLYLCCGGVAGAQTADEQAQPSASERAQLGDERAQRGDERAQQADEQGQPTGEQAQPTNQQAQPTDEQAQRADEEKLRQIINEQGPEPAAGGEAPRVPNRVFRELVDSEKPHGTATEKPQEPASDEPRETPSERPQESASEDP